MPEFVEILVLNGLSEARLFPLDVAIVPALDGSKFCRPSKGIFASSRSSYNPCPRLHNESVLKSMPHKGRSDGSQEDLVLKWPVWIGVVCEDLQAQRQFYRDTLGLKEVRAEEGFVWFEFEDKLFELLAKSDKPQYDRRRVSCAFEVEDIRSTRAELISRGVEALTEIEGGPESRQFWAYFKDAEGNLFEVVQRIPAGSSGSDGPQDKTDET